MTIRCKMMGSPNHYKISGQAAAFLLGKEQLPNWGYERKVSARMVAETPFLCTRTDSPLPVVGAREIWIYRWFFAATRKPGWLLHIVW